jgi:glyoxylase-like metal-dependent hydrolase (beta-lactamase superfamily II)
MCLDNTSHPGRPAPAELVPSRYALRVGEIDVLVVSDGVLPFKTPELATNAAPAARAAWLADKFLPPDVMVWPLNVVVVRSGGQTILIDSGLGVEYPDFARTGRWALRLETAGVDLASVTDVVLTHMHLDHVGGLLVDGVKDRLRPDLKIHAAAAEAKFWASPDFSSAPPCRRGFRARRSPPPSGSWTGTVASCGRSRRSTRWRRGCSSDAPAATPPPQRGPRGVRRRPPDVRR